eukprot:gene11605-15543_t
MEVFVPGRLCILGEHTDWTAEYKQDNPLIENGVTIVCTTNEGLYATCQEVTDSNSLRFIHSDIHNEEHEFSINNLTDINNLLALAKNDSFFSYVAGTVAAIIQKYFSNENNNNHLKHGIFIHNYKTTLPMKKGLSSSAAVCVLIVKSFNIIYDLNLTTEMIMELAYYGEMNTHSKCGRMDQCVAMGSGIAKMEFFGKGNLTFTRLFCKQTIYFVVADLNAFKDTVIILSDLNSCFPIPANNTQALMIEYIHKNIKITNETIIAIESGNVNLLSECMKEAQKSFDKCAMPNCISQLTSPLLHKLMENDELNEFSLAMKGVGAQGDGSIQILCENEMKQSQIMKLLHDKFGMESFSLTINNDV